MKYVSVYEWFTPFLSKNLTLLIGLLSIFSLLSFKVFAADPWEVSINNAKSGLYDINIYAVTWQPGYCDVNNVNDDNCVNEFKVHGVWPYYSAKNDDDNVKNYHPDYCFQSKGCSSTKDCVIESKTIDFLKTNKKMQELYPDNEGLWTHEWKKHGTCSGLNQQQYFKQAADYEALVFPKLDKLTRFIENNKNKMVNVNDIRARLPKNTALRCEVKEGTSYLYEINFLLDREGKAHKQVNTQIGGVCEDSIKLSYF